MVVNDGLGLAVRLPDNSVVTEQGTVDMITTLLFKSNTPKAVAQSKTSQHNKSKSEKLDFKLTLLYLSTFDNLNLSICSSVI